MNGVGDAQAQAAMTMQQAMGMLLPFVTEQGSSSSSGSKLTRPPPPPPGLPPTPPGFAPLPQRGDVCMADSSAVAVADPAAQRKAHHHRRSRSDVPFGYFPPASGSGGGGLGTGHAHHHHLLLPPPKLEAGWGGHLHHGGGDDDLFINAYLNLEGLGDGGLNHNNNNNNSSDSSMKTTNGADSSDNESGEGGADDNRAGGGIRLWPDSANATERREGLKRTAAGDHPGAVVAPMARHARSLSMDSLISKLNFSAAGASSSAAAANGGVVHPGPNRFSLEFGTGEFSPVEMKKIMADDKLAEMALADPKRVKRVLANRQSAARSKERKMRYIAELEQKVQILQTEATKLSAHLTLLQRDSTGIATQNNELKFRLEAMEQQAQLRDALNDALTTEVQRLKLVTAEHGDDCSSNNLAHQIQISAQDQMFQLHQQQATPIPFYQLHQAQQNGAVKKE